MIVRLGSLFGGRPAEIRKCCVAQEVKSLVCFRGRSHGADLPIAELGLVLADDQLARLRRVWVEMSRRSRHALTARLGLGFGRLTPQQTADPLGLTLSRVGQLQRLTLGALAAAPQGPTEPPGPADLADAVTDALPSFRLAAGD